MSGPRRQYNTNTKSAALDHRARSGAGRGAATRGMCERALATLAGSELAPEPDDLGFALCRVPEGLWGR